MSDEGVRVACAIVFAVVVLQSRSTIASDATADKAVDSRIDALFGSHDAVRAFLNTLEDDSANQRWTAIASMIAYPIKIKVDGHFLRLYSPSQLTAHTADVFTPKVIAALKHQSYASLFVNDRGIMIGDGEIWFSPICKGADCTNAPLKITGINP